MMCSLHHSFFSPIDALFVLCLSYFPARTERAVMYAHVCWEEKHSHATFGSMPMRFQYAFVHPHHTKATFTRRLCLVWRATLRLRQERRAFLSPFSTAHTQHTEREQAKEHEMKNRNTPNEKWLAVTKGTALSSQQGKKRQKGRGRQSESGDSA